MHKKDELIKQIQDVAISMKKRKHKEPIDNIIMRFENVAHRVRHHSELSMTDVYQHVSAISIFEMYFIHFLIEQNVLNNTQADVTTRQVALIERGKYCKKFLACVDHISDSDRKGMNKKFVMKSVIKAIGDNASPCPCMKYLTDNPVIDVNDLIKQKFIIEAIEIPEGNLKRSIRQKSIAVPAAHLSHSIYNAVVV
jgi:hypothetical protein